MTTKLSGVTAKPEKTLAAKACLWSQYGSYSYTLLPQRSQQSVRLLKIQE